MLFSMSCLSEERRNVEDDLAIGSRERAEIESRKISQVDPSGVDNHPNFAESRTQTDLQERLTSIEGTGQRERERDN